MTIRRSKRLPSTLYGWVFGENSETVGRLFEIETSKAEALDYASRVFDEEWDGRIGVYKLIKVIRADPRTD